MKQTDMVKGQAIRALCLIVSAGLALLLAYYLPLLSAPTRAFAKGEEGNWSLVIKATDSTEIHYKATTGQVAYCYRYHTHGPDGDGETYTHIQRAKAAADYIYAKGYPNHTTINGKSYTALEAWRVTVYATWIVAEYTDGYGVSWDRAYANGYADLVNDAKKFAEKAKAYKGGDESIDGIACVVYVDGSAEIQPMLIGNQFGHLRIEKGSTDESVLEDSPDSYSLAGAKFGIFEDKACTTSYRNYTLTTDSSGVAYDQDMDIVPDTYYIKELKAPKGFELDKSVHTVKVKSAYGSDQDTSAFWTTLKVKDVPERAKAKVKKSSSNIGLSTGNENYSLEGATYELYGSKADALERTDRIAKLVTQGNGSTSASKYLPLGTYYMIETKASEGFAIDPHMDYRLGKARKVVLENNEEVVVVESAEPPQYGSVKTLLTKKYKAFPQNHAVDQYPLEGARFELKYYETSEARSAGRATRTWVLKTDAGGRISLSKSSKVSGDEFYTDTSGSPVLPLGIYTIEEIFAPDGYLLPGQDSDPDTVETLSFSIDGSSTPSSPISTSFDAYGDEGIVALESAVRGGLCIGKGDALKYNAEQTGGDGSCYNYAQGDAELAKARFAIYNRSGQTIWVDQNSDELVQSDEVFENDSEVVELETAYDEELDAFIAKTPVLYLPYGTYEVVETRPPAGYKASDSARFTVVISQEGQYEQLVYDRGAFDTVVCGGVLVVKEDVELGTSEAIGSQSHGPSTYGASLEGVEFSICNASRDGVFAYGSYVKPGDLVTTIATRWDEEAGAYIAQTARTALPFGTYTIAESASSTGYLLSDGSKRTFTISEDDAFVSVDTSMQPLVWGDRVMRNDMTLKKKAQGLRSLGHVPFKVTNLTTGESHVVVTDANGYYSSSVEWRAHTEMCNANDALAQEDYLDAHDGVIRTGDIVECGTWFGLGEDGSFATPDDDLGAFPYGSYEITELRSEGNQGYSLMNDTFSIERDTSQTKLPVDLGTIDDLALPSISTTAVDKDDGDHELSPAGDAIIVDSVVYKNLDPQKSYVLAGCVMDKESGLPLLDPQGKEVANQVVITPRYPDGTVELEFALDAHEACGKTLVVFERLSEQGQDVPVATHEDLEDGGQSVHVTFSIGTELLDASDSDHRAFGDSVLLVDTVSYMGLDTERAYRLTGTLISTSTHSPVRDAAGNDISSSVTFTPADADGSVEVPFSVDLTDLAGSSVVAFERLYDDTGAVLAVHEDLQDEGQTVTVASTPSPLVTQDKPETPESTEEPAEDDEIDAGDGDEAEADVEETSSTKKGSEKKGDSKETPVIGQYAKTGSASWPILVLTAVLLAGSAVALGYGLRRRHTMYRRM